MLAIVCHAAASAQSVKIYRNDGTTMQVLHSELDSIVALNGEDADKIYKSDGTTIKIPYSEIQCIVAIDEEADTNFVDLGLSVKWAKRNIGAEKPEDYGDYFAWGETLPKSSYTKENSITTGKYFTDIYGDGGYDAARANWGFPARMPTLEEYDELCNKCEWVWTTQNGIDGQLVTGPNGNSIFLPAAGIKRGESLDYAGENGDYWTATPYEDDDKSAYHHIFNTSGYWGSWRLRSDGLSVRAVAGNVQCMSYTGDTLKVDETSAEVCVMFSHVPRSGIIGGVEYSNKAIGKQKQTIEVNEDGEYTITISGLERGTTYKYRSFVKLNDKYVYGEVMQFTTKNNEDNLTKGEWIDLGLSVKWASHNIGAVNPEESGDFFAWGEIYPKTSFYNNNSETMGKDMNDISGDSGYDAASANWGGEARMPTIDEVKELSEKCTWVWTPRNGVNGMLITGPNGNSIFIPASGFRLGPALDYEGDNGFYWSSTPSDTDDNRAYGLSFSKGGFRGTWNERFNGRTIRPVSE